MTFLVRHDGSAVSAARRQSLSKVAARTLSAATLALVAAGLPSVGTAAQEFFCTFLTSPTDCGFVEQAKEPGRATIVNLGRDGTTSVRLHTEPGDNNVAGSGTLERNDLYLAQPGTSDPIVFNEGDEHWWAHSVLFPDDFSTPRWHTYAIAGFHHIGPTGQGNFQLHFQQRADVTEYGDLVFRGYAGTQDQNVFTVTIAPGGVNPPITKNVWYDFVYHVKWSSSTGGYFDAWVRKGSETTYRRVLAYKGPTLYSNSEIKGAYFKLANYHDPVCDPYPACVGSHPPSSVIHDRVVRGTSWQDVALVLGPLEGQHEENAAAYHSNLTPSSWAQYGPETGSFSGGTAVATNETNATATFTFTGTGATWMGAKCTSCGSATVSVDGGAPVQKNTVGPNAPGTLTPEAIHSIGGLAPGTHTMVITSSGDGYVVVDGFWVMPALGN